MLALILKYVSCLYDNLSCNIIFKTSSLIFRFLLGFIVFCLIQNIHVSTDDIKTFSLNVNFLLTFCFQFQLLKSMLLVGVILFWILICIIIFQFILFSASCLDLLKLMIFIYRAFNHHLGFFYFLFLEEGSSVDF